MSSDVKKWYDKIDMLTESHFLTEGSPDKTEVSFDTYEDAGGLLSRDSYEAVTKAQQLHKVRPPARAQATHMGARHEIPIDENTCTVYSILRTEIKDIPGVSETDYSEIVKLSDQEVFAETLLFEGRVEEHNRFVMAYPHIFEKVDA